MSKLYGKRLEWSKKMGTRPSTQVNKMNLKNLLRLTSLGQSFKNKRQYGGMNGIPKAPINGGVARNLIPDVLKNWDVDKRASISGPFYNYLLDNCITTTDEHLTTNQTKTSITINAASFDRMLKKGDTFYIVCRKSFNMKQLTCDADLLHGTTSLSITSTVFTKSDWFPQGSFIISDNKKMVEVTSNAPLFTKIELTNPQYKNLNSTPITLLSAETGVLKIPLNICVLYNHGADEMTDVDLYFGHNLSTTIGQYWASISKFAFRSRDSMLFNFGSESYGAESTADRYSITNLKSARNNGVGLAFKVYTSVNPTSASSTITIYINYMKINV
tara:strand:+ start:348 stop:1337 length:990 start_codon:yes stop_codon:yes gene_type:complete